MQGDFMTISSMTRPQPGVTQSLANQGLKNMDACQRWDSARTTGDQYLTSIMKEGDTPQDQIFAQVFQNTAAAYLTHRNAAVTQVAGLQALAGGIGGALGVAIAQAASQSLDKADRWDDARLLGSNLTQALTVHGDSKLEKLVAQVGLQASGAYLTNKNGFQPNDVAVKMIARGVEGENDKVLAKLADVSVARVDRWDDARTMGYVFLEAIAQHSTNPNSRAIAETALKASGQKLTHQEGAEIQISAYHEILSPSGNS